MKLADAAANLGGSKYDGSMSLEGSGEGWGFNLGALYQFDGDRRVGVHFRSGTSIELRGSVDFQLGLLESFFAAAFPDQSGKVRLDLPAAASISYFEQVTDKLSLMADYTRTYWTSFESLRVEFDEATPPEIELREEWKDADRIAVGASYRLAPSWLLRVGAAWDESPVPNDELRSPRIPDEDRIWATCGLTWSANAAWEVSVAYLRIFVDDPVVDNDSHAPAQHLVGRIDGRAQAASFGVSRKW